MKNTIINGDGTSRTLKAPSDMPSTYSEWRTQMINGTAKADISLDPDGCSQVGTALNKENLLTDATAAALGLTPATATPNDAISTLNNDLANKADLSVIALPYNANTVYAPNDVDKPRYCTFGGRLWQNLLQCVGIEPSEGTYWTEQPVATDLSLVHYCMTESAINRNSDLGHLNAEFFSEGKIALTQTRHVMTIAACGISTKSGSDWMVQIFNPLYQPDFTVKFKYFLGSVEYVGDIHYNTSTDSWLVWLPTINTTDVINVNVSYPINES